MKKDENIFYFANYGFTEGDKVSVKLRSGEKLKGKIIDIYEYTITFEQGIAIDIETASGVTEISDREILDMKPLKS